MSMKKRFTVSSLCGFYAGIKIGGTYDLISQTDYQVVLRGTEGNVTIDADDISGNVSLERKSEPAETKKTKTGGIGMKNLNMGSIMPKISIGKVEGDTYAISPMGLAIKHGTEGNYCVYKEDINDLQTVGGVIFDGMSKFIFKLPVIGDTVKKGDILEYKGSPVVVKQVRADKSLEVFDYSDHQIKVIIAETNAFFGFKCFTKIQPLIQSDMISGDGNLNNFLLLSMMTGEDSGDMNPLMLAMMLQQNGNGSALNPMLLMALAATGESSMKDMLPLMMFTQGGMGDFASNPLMMMALMSEGSDSMLPLIFMMQGQNEGQGMNPLMMMALMGDKSDDSMMPLMLMGMMGGNNGGGFNLFGNQQQPASQAVNVEEVEEVEEDTEE